MPVNNRRSWRPHMTVDQLWRMVESDMVLALQSQSVAPGTNINELRTKLFNGIVEFLRVNKIAIVDDIEGHVYPDATTQLEDWTNPDQTIWDNPDAPDFSPGGTD